MTAKLNETIFGNTATWRSMVSGEVAPPTMKGMSAMLTIIDEVQPFSYVVSPAMYDYMKNRQQGGKEVSDYEIVNSVINERKKAKATQIVEDLEAYFGQFEFEPMFIIGWSVTFDDDDSGKAYSYAAVRGERKWYITHDSRDYTTDELIAYMAGLAMRGTLTTPDDELVLS